MNTGILAVPHWRKLALGILVVSLVIGVGQHTIAKEHKETVVVLAVDFETSPAWLLGDLEPLLGGSDYWGIWDNRVYSGAKSAWCAVFGESGGMPNTLLELYDNYMDSYMRFAALDFTVNPDYEIEFAIWREFWNQGDSCSVSLVWGGGSCELVRYDASNQNWRSEVIMVSAPCPEALTRTDVQLEFRFRSDGTNRAEGVYIDDVIVRERYTRTPTTLPTSTLTPTASATATPTRTPTGTLTGTRSPTLTPTLTRTATATPSNTRSPTVSPTRTLTVTVTPTISPSATPSPTIPISPTATEVASPTATVAAPPTDTPTLTPTETMTATATESSTVPPTETSTLTPTLTPTTTPTVEPTLTQAPTETPVTPYPTATPTITPTLEFYPPYTLNHYPEPDAINVQADTAVEVDIIDDGYGVDITRIIMVINQQVVTPDITGLPAQYHVRYAPLESFPLGELVQVRIDAADLAPMPNVMETDVYSFRIEAATTTPTETATLSPTTTATETLTPTPTLTPSATLSPTLTPTLTPSYSPTLTATLTYSPTNSPTTSPTATPTETPTLTPTETPTETPTLSPTDTVTVTSTVTRTPTESPTSSPTVTLTPTSSPTSTLSPTGSPTVTWSPTRSPTVTWSPTESPTITLSPTRSPTVTLSPTLSPTATNSPTLSPTRSATATWSPTRSPTVTLSPTSTPTLTISPTLSPTRSPTTTRSPTVTPTPTSTWQYSPTRSATPTLSPTYTPTHTSTQTATGSPTSGPTGTRTPTLTPTLTLTATLSPTRTSTRTATSSPTFSPTTSATRTFTPTISSTASPSPTRTATRSPTVTVTATPTATELPVVDFALLLNDFEFCPGELFQLRTQIFNHFGSQIDVDEYVVLDVYGQYFFSPYWTQEISFVRRSITAGMQMIVMILDFQWPSGSGEARGIVFHGAITQPDSYNLYSYDSISFDFTESCGTPVPSLTPTNTPTGQATATPTVVVMSPTPTGVEVVVPGNQQMVSTGLRLQPGQRIRIQASGWICFHDFLCDDTMVGPNGWPAQCVEDECMSQPYNDPPGYFHGALIGWVESSGAPFLVGDYYEGAPGSGMLYLGINDGNVSDNDGEFVATIENARDSSQQIMRTELDGILKP